MPAKRNAGKFGCPTYNQARKIAARFGGEAKLAAIIGVRRETVYRWQMRRPYGSDGLIPSIHIDKIKLAARHEGILISPEDWVPQIIVYDQETKTPITDHRKKKLVVGASDFYTRKKNLSDILR